MVERDGAGPALRAAALLAQLGLAPLVLLLGQEGELVDDFRARLKVNVTEELACEALGLKLLAVLGSRDG